jgi:hypothetical protein
MKTIKTRMRTILKNKSHKNKLKETTHKEDFSKINPNKENHKENHKDSNLKVNPNTTTITNLILTKTRTTETMETSHILTTTTETNLNSKTTTETNTSTRATTETRDTSTRIESDQCILLFISQLI